MGCVMISCPVTGKAVSTGIDTELATLQQAVPFLSSTQLRGVRRRSIVGRAPTPGFVIPSLLSGRTPPDRTGSPAISVQPIAALSVIPVGGYPIGGFGAFAALRRAGSVQIDLNSNMIGPPACLWTLSIFAILPFCSMSTARSSTSRRRRTRSMCRKRCCRRWRWSASARMARLALVSGRPIADLDLIFAPLRLPAIGGHGAEIRPIPAATATSSARPRSTARSKQKLMDIAARYARRRDRGQGLLARAALSPGARAGLERGRRGVPRLQGAIRRIRSNCSPARR